jgi:hypothetical protein
MVARPARAARHDDRSIRGEFGTFARTAQSGIRRPGPGSSARSMLPRSVTLTQWHGVSSSGSTIRAIASVAATPTAGAGELRWAGPSSGGFRPGRSGFTTRTMPWPPGSKVATKGHRPGSAAGPRSWSERHRASRGNANDRPPAFAVVQPPGMTGRSRGNSSCRPLGRRGAPAGRSLSGGAGTSLSPLAAQAPPPAMMSPGRPSVKPPGSSLLHLVHLR